ncbi:MAG TPA: M36 family metallopeptidase [Kofleriaceae bacterium]|nr:M36 family metallopeptidase [Kofleriaceae bacterium]
MIFTIACATGPSTSAPPGTGNPGDPGDPNPGGGAPPTISTDQLATALGVSIMSSEPSGAPRLLRTIVPRPSAAGVPAAAAARDHIAALSALWVRDAQPMALADNGAQQLRNGATLVKLVQNVGGVPVHGGELHVLLGADGGLAAISGTLLPAAAAPSFASSATDALSHALDQHFGAARPQMAITEAAASGDTGGWQPLQVASTPRFQVDEARARRTLAQVGDHVVPAYEVEVQGDAAPDPLADPGIPTFSAHSYLVGDDGKILDDEDLVANDAFVYRVYMETTGNRRPLDGAMASFAPHPTGVPDGSGPSLIPQNLIVMDSFNKNFDPWLPTNATTTSGNNAEAFADVDGTRSFTPGDVRPVVKSGRVLNYVYDHTLEPLANTNQQMAAAVNTFFLVNWMHDWYYDSGFTEVTANAQLDNFGRGGVANDPLRVDAQAGANVGSRNNANMSTPADGARPTMNMFLWTAGTITGLAGPTGAPRTEPFAAGPRNFDIVGDLAFATDGTAPNDDGCQAITSNVAGKIAVLNFSTAACNSAVTVANAAAAGAIGVILVDTGLDDPRAFAGSATANIPGVAMGKTDGAALEAKLTAGPVTVELTSAVAGVERDGDLDNTVIAHEWGHYLHHRLENCGGAGSNQCAGMSEGWGDFNSLMMMAREGDNRDGVYAEGYYALADGVTPNFAYFGIRRYPYSRDHTKNDLSFRHISNGVALPTNTPGFPGDGTNNSEVHNTGEIWAAMMWEAFNVVADAHGVEVARRRMADYIVAGFLISPRNPSFTEQRDAILIAAGAMDSDDMLVMAGAFASRGIGSCAISPDKASAANAGVVESGTLAAKLSAGGLTVTDDGPRGDHDGILDPGESGTLRLTLANNGIIAAENVTVTATSAGVGVTLGKPLVIAAQPQFSSSTLSIPISLAANAPVNTMITINVHVAGQFTCDRNGIDASVTVLTGANPMMINASQPVAEPSRVVSTIVAPATSLRAFDAVCTSP